MSKRGIAQLTAFLLVVIASAYAAYAINASNISRVEQSELVACARVQLLRDQANGTNFLIYDTFKQAAASQKKLAHETKNKDIRKQARAAQHRAEKVRDTTVVTGPTDCDRAVKHPATYIPPAPEFIATESPRIAIARKRSEAIVNKAERGIPLYLPRLNGEKP
jgi:quinol monooxygenase YgiN